VIPVDVVPGDVGGDTRRFDIGERDRKRGRIRYPGRAVTVCSGKPSGNSDLWAPQPDSLRTGPRRRSGAGTDVRDVLGGNGADQGNQQLGLPALVAQLKPERPRPPRPMLPQV